MGRPGKLTVERKNDLLELLKLGLGLESACAAVGIDYSTYRRWMLEGQVQARGKFREFFEDVQRAIAQSESTLLRRITEASRSDWRAAAWILERRFSERWSATARVNLRVEKELEAALDHLQRKMSPAAYQEMLQALADEQPGLLPDNQD